MASRPPSIATLCTEIDKIVSVPYAVFLKTFLHVLNNTSDDEIYLWTIIKECQLRGLISRIVTALDQDEAAWPVLVRLMRTRVIRDEVIRQDPSTLSLVFRRAETKEVYETCLIICKNPFEENFSPSQDYFDFVDSILANSRNENQDAWIEHAHDVLSVMPALTLSTIDDNIIESCVKLWSESSKATLDVTFIRFLSIAANIHQKLADNVSSFDSDTVYSHAPTHLANWVMKCSTFFIDHKAIKVVKTVLLRTLHFLSEKPHIQELHIICCLNIVRQVLEGMTENTLLDAIQDRETAQMIVKLVQKVTQKNVSDEARVYLSSVLVMLDPSCQYWDASLSDSVFARYTHEPPVQPNNLGANEALQKLANLKIQREHPEVLIRILAPRLSRKPILGPIMQSFINFCRPGICTTLELICSLALAVTFLNNVSNLLAHEKLSDGVFDALVDVQVPDWWDWTLYSANKPVPCWKRGPCSRVKDQLQQRLMSYISCIIITCACTSGKKISRKRCDLLQTVAHRCGEGKESYQCSYSRTAFPGKPVLLDTVLTAPETCYVTDDGLDKTLALCNEHYANTVRKHVQNICSDLQVRCQNVEEPLKAAHAKTEALEKELQKVHSSTRLMQDEHKAQKMSMEYAINTAHQEIALLKAQQISMEQTLQEADNKLQSITDQVKNSVDAYVNLHEQHDILRGELEQEKRLVEELKIGRATLTSEKEAVLQQLRQVNDKQQRLLNVLNGELQNSTC